MEFYAKKFCELSTVELYEIIKSRTEVFLLEQNIICQDLDDTDYDSLHCFFYKNKRAIAYLRAFLSDAYTVTIGRVLTLEHKKGLGRQLMEKSIEEIWKHFDVKFLSVHAQTQAKGFYEKMGFEAFGDEFLEEGVPHVTMKKFL